MVSQRPGGNGNRAAYQPDNLGPFGGVGETTANVVFGGNAGLTRRCQTNLVDPRIFPQVVTSRSATQ